ncbi:MAG: hypothetical protein WBC33_07230 [Conexibacter sp.]
MAVDVDALATALRGFIVRHDLEFSRLTGRRSQLLELGALSIATKHYELHGYDVVPQNVRRGEFRVKLGTKGAPWNFSWFSAQRGGERVEIHGNLPVEDALATPGARYVVDVAVIRADSFPTARDRRREWTALANPALVTFLEAKALVVYPMLLAQFVGIVHELKPQFLAGRRPWGFRSRNHFDPTLVSLGYLHGTCRNIVAGYRDRKCMIGVVPSFDEEIASLRLGAAESPLDANHRRAPHPRGSDAAERT